jgi:urate oxidase/2-oxo-4-hydroxy-4-carboxy-5-ureidoimidazoline decarboxylase
LNEIIIYYISWNIKIVVGGEQLFSSFSEGDNELIVATDSMKNFIQKHLAYTTGEQ